MLETQKATKAILGISNGATVNRSYTFLQNGINAILERLDDATR